MKAIIIKDIHNSIILVLSILIPPLGLFLFFNKFRSLSIVSKILFSVFILLMSIIIYLVVFKFILTQQTYLNLA